MPGAPESSLSVFNLMHFGYHAVEPKVVVLGRAEPAQPVSLSMPAPVPLPPGQLDGEPIPAQRAPFRVQPVPLIWAFGALLVAIYAVGQNIALSSRVARQRQVTDEGVLSLLENCKETMGVRSYLSVVETPRVKSPALLGFIRPRLLLPEGMVETLDRGELRYVFLHELAHLKRRDIAVNWLMAALQLMHWFNPLIWYAFYRMRADREIACDALVLSRTRPGESKNYGRTIVSLLERFSQPRRVPGLAGIVEDKSQIKRRITMIALFKRDSLLRSVVSLVLLAALACVVLTDARGAPEGATGDARDTVFVAGAEEQAERDEEMAEMEEKLDTVVSLDFSKGTDIRDIVEFVSDFARVNVILDERVMLPPPDLPTVALDDTVPKSPGAIEPTIPTEMHRVYIKDMPLRNALEAAFKPAGLEYVVQPDFIWLSRPDVLRAETFPPVESRMTVPSGSGERRDELIGQVQGMAAKLRTRVSIDFLAGTDVRDVLNFLSDFAQVNIVLDERVMLPPVPPPTAPGAPPSRPEAPGRPSVDGIERTVYSNTRQLYIAKGISFGDGLAAMLKQMGLDYAILPEYIWVSRPDVLKKETFRAVETRLRPPQEEGDANAANAKLEKMSEELQDRVSADFAEGTDLRDVFQFLSDFVGVNIVLDERVILPADGTTARPVGGIEPTIDGRSRRIYLNRLPLGDALIAICKAMGLDYAVTPEFIWISTPDVLRRKSSTSPDELKAASESVTRPRVTTTTRRTPEPGEETVVIEHTGGEEPLPGIQFRGTQQTSPYNIYAVITLNEGERVLVREGKRFARRQAVLEKIDLEAKRIIFRWVPTGARYEVKMREPPEDAERIPEETSEVSELLDVGVELYADGYYRAALDRFTRALVIDPENETAQKYVEECTQYLIPGRVGEGVEVEYPEERAPLGPSSQEVRQATVEKYLAFGQEHFDKGEYEKAAQEWERALLIDPTNQRATASLREAKRRQPETERPRRTVVDRGVLSGESPPVGGPRVMFGESPPVHATMEAAFSELEEIEDKLHETKVALDFPEATDIREVLEFLSEAAGVDIALDPRVMQRTDSGAPSPAAQPAEVLVLARKVYLKDIAVHNALKVIADQVLPDGYSVEIQREGVLISTPDLSRNGPALLQASPFSEKETIQEKLDINISVDFAEGTDIRDVLTFLSDFAGVDIVLDERVMLDSPIETAYEGRVNPTIESSSPRVWLRDIALQDALKAILSRMGLAYRIQPDFIWVSRPDILRRESLEPLQTRRYTLDPSVSRDEIMPALETLPDVIEPYTAKVISHAEFNPATNTLTIHNTPSNFDVIEQVLRLSPPKPRKPPAGPGIISQIRRIEEKLSTTRITADYVAGTAIRDVLSFLSDALQVNIVLDERVMLDTKTSRTGPGADYAEPYFEPTVEPEIAGVNLKDTPADEVLKAILEPMGLAHKVQPGFIWVSSPDILRNESFEPLETRYYLLQKAYSAKKILAKLREEIPDIIEPYTGQTLSYMDLSPTTNLLIIHNTPSNFEIIEKILEDHDRPLEQP
jgi:beta-lactamase regulating signal transducer with metallopeptidase domain/tetratricopeptide (TPR) repeat protein